MFGHSNIAARKEREGDPSVRLFLFVSPGEVGFANMGNDDNDVSAATEICKGFPIRAMMTKMFRL